MKTIIRLATENEKHILKYALMNYLSELTQFVQHESSGEITYKYFDLYWSDPDRYPYIMLRNGDLIGFCLLRDIGSVYSIAEFSIIPEFRQKGYGKQLINFIIKFCKEKKKHTKIIANSLINNDVAKKFWNNNGFRTTKTIIIDGIEYYENIKNIE